MPAKAEVRESRECLLADPRVERWYKNRGTKSTSETYLANLELFLRRADIDVDRLIRIASAQRNGKGKDGRFADLILTWVEKEREAGRPDAYLAVVWASLRSFLKSVEAAPSWVPKLKVRSGSTILNEVVPTPEQLRAVLDRTAIPRTRAAILFLATTGVRPGVVASRATANGLRLRDLPDLDVTTLSLSQVPFRVNVPAELSKGGSGYFTFGTAETGEALTAYLRHRVARGEELTPASALFAPEPKTPDAHLRMAEDNVAFLSEKGFSQEIRIALRKTQPEGVRWRPYVLRSFASSQLMLAENAGLITRDAREFMLGHVADIGRRYNIGKGRVRSDLENDVREMYTRASDRFLRVLTISERGVDYRPILRVLLSGAGYTKAQIDAMGDLSEERVIEAIRAKRNETVQVEAPKPGENAKVVPVSDLDRYLSAGWKPISAAGSDRFVIGAPN